MGMKLYPYPLGTRRIDIIPHLLFIILRSSTENGQKYHLSQLNSMQISTWKLLRFINHNLIHIILVNRPPLERDWRGSHYWNRLWLSLLLHQHVHITLHHERGVVHHCTWDLWLYLVSISLNALDYLDPYELSYIIIHRCNLFDYCGMRWILLYILPLCWNLYSLFY
jgi:hypothetical protein